MNLRFATVIAASAAVFSFSLVSAHAQSGAALEHGRVFAPDTSIPYEADRGERVHTNHLIRIMPYGGLGVGGGMNPAQMRSFYGASATGGSGVIAIVDAYHYPTALNDFNVFSAQYGLPLETSTNPLADTNKVFEVVYAKGNRAPRTDGGWSQEAALDIEWAHAMAPGAKIVLVEAASSGFSDMFAAVDKAKNLPGVTQVSMSWGGGEFSSESSYDFHFNSSTVAFFASSGDTGGVVEYPSSSPYVTAVGGTSVATYADGSFQGETGWSGAGGGTSQYEAKPGFQSVLSTVRRAVPDISSNADPNTGVSVYDSTAYQGYSGWMVFGGTSVAAPCMAAMHNASGTTHKTTSSFLSYIYASYATSPTSSNYRDITSGYNGFSAGAGWDFVTGVGSPFSSLAF